MQIKGFSRLVAAHHCTYTKVPQHLGIRGYNSPLRLSLHLGRATQTSRFLTPVGANRYDGRTIKFVLCNYKCILRTATTSEWATYAFTAGNGTDLTVLGGYKTDSGSGPVSWEIIWIDALSRWMSTSHHNKRPGFV